MEPQQVTIGYGFWSDRLRKWRKSFQPIKELNKTKTNQPIITQLSNHQPIKKGNKTKTKNKHNITFDTQFKTALIISSDQQAIEG